MFKGPSTERTSALPQTTKTPELAIHASVNQEFDVRLRPLCLCANLEESREGASYPRGALVYRMRAAINRLGFKLLLAAIQASTVRAGSSAISAGAKLYCTTIDGHSLPRVILKRRESDAAKASPVMLGSEVISAGATLYSTETDNTKLASNHSSRAFL